MKVRGKFCSAFLLQEILNLLTPIYTFERKGVGDMVSPDAIIGASKDTRSSDAYLVGNSRRIVVGGVRSFLLFSQCHQRCIWSSTQSFFYLILIPSLRLTSSIFKPCSSLISISTKPTRTTGRTTMDDNCNFSYDDEDPHD